MTSTLLIKGIRIGGALFGVLFWFMIIGSLVNKRKKGNVFNAAGWYFILILLTLLYYRNDMLKEKWIPQQIMSSVLNGLYIGFVPPLVISGILAIGFHLKNKV